LPVAAAAVRADGHFQVRLALRGHFGGRRCIPYSFTVGLYQSYGHPELIAFGLKSEVAHKILCNATAGLPEERLDLSLPTDALAEGHPCCFAEVAKSHYYEFVGFGRWYYRGNDFPLYQIVWPPSREGRFPWHPKASEEFKLAQPVIAHAQWAAD
jgi:hypothetical protein